MQPSKRISFDRPRNVDDNYRSMVKDNTPPNPLMDALKGPPTTDDVGIQRAYESDNNVHVYRDTLFIRGTKGP